MDPEVIELLIPFAGMAMIVFIVWLGARARQAHVQARTELHKHLLDKFSSGTELAKFLETEGGKKMIEGPRKGPRKPYRTHPTTRDNWNCSDEPGSGSSGSHDLRAGPCHRWRNSLGVRDRLLDSGVRHAAAVQEPRSGQPTQHACWADGCRVTRRGRFRHRLTARSAIPVDISGSSMGSFTASTQVMPMVTHGPAADRMMDEGAFQVFYYRTAPGLRSYVRRSACSADVADDILQEAFLRFLRVALADLDPSRQKAYLYKIASRLLVDHWRRVNREQRWDWQTFVGR